MAAAASSLSKRAIFNSQTLIGRLYRLSTINRLIRLFDEKPNKNYPTISDYISEERQRRGLNEQNVSIRGEVYGHNDNNSTIYLQIMKNDNDFIHLTIHMSPAKLNIKSKDHGMIHIYKDIYKVIHPSTQKKFLYAYIFVKVPIDKPHSLEFSIEDGIITSSTNVQNVSLYDNDIQQEMDVIITVLNRLFDENDDIYIGKEEDTINIHDKTNNIAENINKRQLYITRSNSGKLYIPWINSPINLKLYKKSHPMNKTHKKKTRKRK